MKGKSDMKKLLSIGLTALILSGCGQSEPQKIELTPDGRYFDSDPISMLKVIQGNLPSDANTKLETDGDNPVLTVTEPSGVETFIVAFNGSDDVTSGIMISAMEVKDKSSETTEYYIYDLPKTVLEIIDVSDDGADDLAKEAYRNYLEYYTSGNAVLDNVKVSVGSTYLDDTVTYVDVIAPETNGFWK